MKYQIINAYEGFQNSYNALAWKVIFNGRCVGSFRTRAAAREYIKEQA